MPIYINILLILVLFFFNAVFAMYEIAMVSARRTRLHQRADDGQSGANLAIKLQNDPNQEYLSAVQIMITMIDTLAGGIGGAMLAGPLALVLRKIAWLAPAADTVALILVVIVITYFSIVLVAGWAARPWAARFALSGLAPAAPRRSRRRRARLPPGQNTSSATVPISTGWRCATKSATTDASAASARTPSRCWQRATEVFRGPRQGADSDSPRLPPARHISGSASRNPEHPGLDPSPVTTAYWHR